ncbi:hypothetical protein RRG08_031909 [Elysia crispata]|uniref:NADH dehydrogenase [ubiquinone] 1 alpha subcomplex subunit 4 n=1 Tax=Elysia crispata TaxID=231223 RepID=A0AAE1DZ52_9GAST|nr:hypothetical protein RRG08_031909 [Elysia crispata]
MQGLTLASLKRHPSLIPLFVCVGGGMAWATYYTLRLCIRNPDVGWVKKHDGLANNRWPINSQYKFYSPLRDYSKESFPPERPNI